MKKKCLMVIPHMSGGGAERVMSILANDFNEEYEVKIVAITTADSFYPLYSGVSIVGLGVIPNRKNKVTWILSKIFGGFLAFFRLKKVIRAFRPDVVLSFLGPTNNLSVLVKMLSAKNFKLVVSERADPWVRGKFARTTEKILYPHADAIVCQSEKVISFFPQKAQRKAVVIPNPIDIQNLPEPYAGERRNTIINVGRLDAQKNQKMLIEAFADLHERFPDYTLEIYGEGPLRSKLEKNIETCGLHGKVFLMGAKQNVFELINNASLFVLSSNFEGFPNALLEAMALGLPVISTDFPTAVAKQLIDDENGRVIPVGDKAGLKNAICELLENNSLRKKMGNNNLYVKERYSEQRICEEWERVLFNENKER